MAHRIEHQHVTRVGENGKHITRTEALICSLFACLWDDLSSSQQERMDHFQAQAPLLARLPWAEFAGPIRLHLEHSLG